MRSTPTWGGKGPAIDLNLSDILQTDYLELGRFTDEELAIVDGSIDAEETAIADDATRGGLAAAYRSLSARNLISADAEDGIYARGALAVISSFWNERDRVAQVEMSNDPTFINRNLFLTQDGWVLEDGVDDLALHSFVVRSLDAQVEELAKFAVGKTEDNGKDERVPFTVETPSEESTIPSPEFQHLVDSAVSVSTLDVARLHDNGFSRLILTIVDHETEGLWVVAPAPDPQSGKEATVAHLRVLPIERRKVAALLRDCLLFSLETEPAH